MLWSCNSRRRWDQVSGASSRCSDSGDAALAQGRGQSKYHRSWQTRWLAALICCHLNSASLWHPCYSATAPSALRAGRLHKGQSQRSAACQLMSEWGPRSRHPHTAPRYQHSLCAHLCCSEFSALLPLFHSLPACRSSSLSILRNILCNHRKQSVSRERYTEGKKKWKHNKHTEYFTTLWEERTTLLNISCSVFSIRRRKQGH